MTAIPPHRRTTALGNFNHSTPKINRGIFLRHRESSPVNIGGVYRGVSGALIQSKTL